MIDLSFEDRKVIRIREKSSTYKVLKPKDYRKETVIVPLNTSVAQFHTISVKGYSLASASGHF